MLQWRLGAHLLREQPGDLQGMLPGDDMSPWNLKAHPQEHTSLNKATFLNPPPKTVPSTGDYGDHFPSNNPNDILFSHKEKQNIVIYREMDEMGGHIKPK